MTSETSQHWQPENVRTRIFLRSVLPLLKVVWQDRAQFPHKFRKTKAVFQFVALEPAALPPEDRGAYLQVQEGQLSVHTGIHQQPTLTYEFKTQVALNDFFAGKSVLPRIRGLFRHPILNMKVLQLLMALRILDPETPTKKPADRELRVKLIMYMLTHALSQLQKGQHPDMCQLVDKSPDRIYQWSIEGTDIASYLRMHKGKAKSGRGIYSKRRPFVHFVFSSIDAAFEVYTNTDSQMAAVEKGYVYTWGSPEYSRKISILQQKIDELLTGQYGTENPSN